MAKKKDAAVVEIPKPNLPMIEVTIVGDSSLIVHNWSEKAKKEMRDRQMKKPKAAKEAKNPKKEYEGSLYYLNGSKKTGFPAIGFKKAMVSACRNVDGIPMTLARGAFSVIGDLVEIKGKHHIREDMVRLPTGVADIRYRAEYPSWKCVLPIRYNASVLSKEQVVNLLNIAGFAVGIGEWRPEKSGDHGMFHVE